MEKGRRSRLEGETGEAAAFSSSFTESGDTSIFSVTTVFSSVDMVDEILSALVQSNYLFIQQCVVVV